MPALGWDGRSSLSTYMEHSRVEEQGQGRHQVIVTPLLHLWEQPEGTEMSCWPGAAPKTLLEVLGDSSPTIPSPHLEDSLISTGKLPPKLNHIVGQAGQHNLLLCVLPGMTQPFEPPDA